MLDLLIFSNMIGRKMASGKMLDLLLWGELFFVLVFFLSVDCHEYETSTWLPHETLVTKRNKFDKISLFC